MANALDKDNLNIIISRRKNPETSVVTFSVCAEGNYSDSAATDKSRHPVRAEWAYVSGATCTDTYNTAITKLEGQF